MSILNMSVSGALMILIIGIIRALAINKLPKKIFMVLWCVVLTRLLIPYSIPSPLSVYSFVGRMTAMQEVTLQEDPPSVMQVYAVAVLDTDNANTQAPVIYWDADGVPFQETSAISVNPWMIVWLVGFIGIAGFFLISYIRCRRVFREALPVNDEVARSWLDAHRLRRAIAIRYSDRISAPLTFGILRPVILVPKTFPWTDYECVKYALEHELVHIRRFDALTKLLLTSALCIHWFNPAVWGMYILANRDIELSCDEAVIRLFGENTKSAYAYVLIRMEEIRSGLRPLCNNFSKNAIEERIGAIMKMKKTTRAAAVVAGILVIGITVVFATSGQTMAADTGDNTAMAPKDGTTNILTYADPDTGKAYLSFDNGVTYTKENDIMMYTAPWDGNSYYSFDGGKTWKPMTEEEFQTSAGYGCEIEWWTEEEYAAWLEEEKTALRDLIGERAWTSGEGWFTWDEKRVDRAIALHEQTLQDIRNGWKISKSFGDGDTMIMYSPEEIESVSENVSDISLAPETEEIDLSEFEPFGLVSRDGELFYQGKKVAFFTDRVVVDDRMIFIRYNYLGQSGEVFIHTVRQATQSADGSSDPFGRLVGIEEYKEDEIKDVFCFEPEVLQQEAIAFSAYASESFDADIPFMEDLDRYEPFGVTFVKKENYGNLYYNGKLVEVLVDHSPDGGYRSFRSSDQGEIKLQTVYDGRGNLTGLEEIRD